MVIRASFHPKTKMYDGEKNLSQFTITQTTMNFGSCIFLRGSPKKIFSKEVFTYITKMAYYFKRSVLAVRSLSLTVQDKGGRNRSNNKKYC